MTGWREHPSQPRTKPRRSFHGYPEAIRKAVLDGRIIAKKKKKKKRKKRVKLHEKENKRNEKPQN